MANEEHLQKLKQGVSAWNAWRQEHPGIRIDLNKADLNGTDLSGAHLSGTDLSGAHLRGAHLRRADLSRAHFRGADLREADLSGTDLREANLSTANLRGVRLRGADLRAADLRAADLRAADLRAAKLIEAKLDGATLTNACLWETQRAEWSIQGIVCEAVYWDENRQERTTYSPDEFEHLYANKMARIFLCHANEDKPRIEEIYQQLKGLRFKPWMDKMDLLPGQLWEIEIPNALKVSDFILIFLSQNSVDKLGYIQREFKLALDALTEIPEGMIHIIPVRLDNCDVPAPLRRFQWGNLFDEGGFERVVQAIRVGLSQRQR